MAKIPLWIKQTRPRRNGRCHARGITLNKSRYIYRKRTLNSYYAISTEAWREVMELYENNPLVYSCGKIEGELGTTSCSRCGNCLREYFNTKEKLL